MRDRARGNNRLILSRVCFFLPPPPLSPRRHPRSRSNWDATTRVAALRGSHDRSATGSSLTKELARARARVLGVIARDEERRRDGTKRNRFTTTAKRDNAIGRRFAGFCRKYRGENGGGYLPPSPPGVSSSFRRSSRGAGNNKWFDFESPRN